MTKNRQEQSRRHFLMNAGSAISLGVGPAAEALSGQPKTLAGLDETTSVFVNGRIHTMDAADTEVSTVTIRHNRIVGMGGPAPKRGSESELLTWADAR
jgi:hypothetical protein